MARRSRKRARKELLDQSPNPQEAQAQLTKVNAEKPQLVSTEPEPTLPKDLEIRMDKEKKVKKIEGEERNEPSGAMARKSVNGVDSEHHEFCPKSDPLCPKDSESLLLPEREPVVVKNETNEVSIEPDSTRKKKSKRKRKSLSASKGAETNHLHSEHRELSPNLDTLAPKDSDSMRLPEPEPEPVVGKNETNQLCTEPESTTPRKRKKKRKRKSFSKNEGAETNHGDSGHPELCPNLDPFPPKDSEPVLLPEREPVAEKSETNQLCAAPESTTPRKRKKKRKRKSLSKSEGADETNHGDSGHPELCPNLDLLPPKDSEPVLLPEREPFAEKNETNQLFIEPESTPSRKMERKRKRKSLSKSEGVETNHVNSEHRELCPNLAALPPKVPDPLLLPEPAPVGEKNEANQLCTGSDSTPPKFEGAEINHMGSENLQLCPKSDPLPSKDSGPILLPETEPAPPKEVEQKKKRRRQKKKKKNKGELEGEGVKSNRPNDEHAQQCLEAKPITLEERNQGERKRQVMNETHDSSVGSRVTHNYNLRSGTGAGILSNEGIAPGPWVPKGPLKDYERYERCLECRQICQKDQQCRRRRYLNNNLEICFFCCANGHTLGRCPMAPGAKCAKGIIMVDDFVKKKCREVTPANVPTPPIVPAPIMSQLLLLCQLLLFGQPIHHS